MCFSAEASFIASSVLCVTGVVAIKKAPTPSHLLLAGIPLFFSLQQFTEGFVWLALTNAEYAVWYNLSVHAFLLFALVAWPVLVPLSLMLIEKNKKRKKILKIFFWFGALFSVYTMYCLLFRDVTAKIVFLHIRYDIDYPIVLPKFRGIIYFIPSVIPPFISSIKKMKIFGCAVLLSFIITNIYFKENVVSVWCFFAAIISIVILFAIWDKNNKNHRLTY
ncbi:MAG: hypothetical protein PHD97_07635 [Bacteroidales bacterium]|nr:hypothetical protein [Bacteroidales bacterium]